MPPRPGHLALRGRPKPHDLAPAPPQTHPQPLAHAQGQPQTPARLLRRALHALVTPRWLGLPVPQFRKYPPALALRDIALRFDSLPPVQRDAVISLGRAHWPAAIRLCLADPDPAARRAAVARALADPAADPDILPAALCDPDPAVARDAELALQRLVDAALASHPSPDTPDTQIAPATPATPASPPTLPTPDHEALAAIGLSLSGAVERADRHRRPAVLALAARWAADPPRHTRPQTPDWLTRPDHPAHILLRSLIRRSDAPATRAAAWAWLAHAPLARACAQRLCEPLPSDAPSDLLRRAHLALAPARLANLRAHAPKDHSLARALLPADAPTSQLPLPARLGLCRLLERWPAPRLAREEALARLLTDPAPTVRHAALRAAVSLDLPLLADLCFDPHPRVAASAAAALRTLASSALPSSALPAALLRSPHPAVRALASTATPNNPRTPRTPRAPRNALSPRSSPALPRPPLALTCNDHLDLPRVLAARATPLSPSDTLALCALLRAAASDPHHPTPRTAAAAAVTLARAAQDPHHPDLHRALAAALAAPDPRLRSSALDALVLAARRSAPHAHPDLLPALLSSTADPAHRVRGSAARGLLLALAEPKLLATAPATIPTAPHHTPAAPAPNHTVTPAPAHTLAATARKALTALLRDHDPAPRLAGLWAAHRVASVASRLPQVPDLVRALNLRPASDHEALRATIAADRFAWELRADWSSRAMA